MDHFLASPTNLLIPYMDPCQLRERNSGKTAVYESQRCVND
uniref:Uncharacterized protein n=1 Tax=Rhizophora mucronata TaxID=61149 RepID=A0A2P2KI84_RHIMU